MGLPKFLKVKLKKDKSAESADLTTNVPLPPQKPSEGSPTSPSTPSLEGPPTPGGLPPPPMPDNAAASVPSIPDPSQVPSTPSLDTPSVPSLDAPPLPGPEQPASLDVPPLPTPDQAPSINENIGGPSLDSPPSEETSLPTPGLAQESTFDSDELQMPSAPQMQMPTPPQESQALGPPDSTGVENFDLSNLDNKHEENDWTKEHEPTETSGETSIPIEENLEELPEAKPGIETLPQDSISESVADSTDSEFTFPEEPLPDFDEPKKSAEPEAPHAPGEEIPDHDIHEIEGELYVKAHHYQDLFHSIKEANNGIKSFGNSINTYAELTNEELPHLESFSTNLHTVHENIRNIDHMLFIEEE